MSVNVIYTTEATATGGGRDGTTRTPDGSVDLRLVVPKEMGGPGGEGANPEKLFAAGYAACFLGAVRFHANKDKVKLSDETSVTAKVGIGMRDDGQGFGLEVELSVSLPGIDPAVADDLLARAHVTCPYSDATRNNIKVDVHRV